MEGGLGDGGSGGEDLAGVRILSLAEGEGVLKWSGELSLDWT